MRGQLVHEGPEDQPLVPSQHGKLDGNTKSREDFGSHSSTICLLDAAHGPSHLQNRSLAGQRELDRLIRCGGNESFE